MSLLADIRFAIRMLGASRGFTAVAVLCLALGIGANSAIFTIVEKTLLHSLPYKNPEQLVTIHTSFPGGGLARYGLSFDELWDVEKRSDSLEQVAAYAHLDGNTMFHEGDRPKAVSTLIVSWNTLDLLGVKPALGRDLRQEESVVGKELVIILTHDLWQREYRGDPRALGKKVVIDTEPHEIVGVLPPGIRFPLRPDAEILAPLAFRPKLHRGRTARHMRVLGRMKPGVSLSDLRAELARIAGELRREYPKAYPEEAKFTLIARGLDDNLYGSVRPAMLALLAAVALVLLIACANVASLLLAKGMTREREFAVRAALGASRRRLAMQLLTESLVLSLFGAAGGLLGALWGTDLLMAFYPDSLPSLGSVRVGEPVLAFTIGVSLLTGLVAGLMPALQSSRVDLQSALKDGGVRATVGRRGRRIRGALVAAEIALALVLLVGAGLMLRSLGEIRSVDLGFRTHHLVTMKLKLPWVGYLEPGPRQKFVKELLERTRTLPGETEVAVASTAPLDSHRGIYALQFEGAKGLPPAVEAQVVSTNYFELMGIDVLEGRTFDASGSCGEPVPLVLDEAAAKLFSQDQSPVGTRATLALKTDKWHEIIGVVANVKASGATTCQRPMVYFPAEREPPIAMTLLVRTNQEPGDIAAAVEKEVRAIDANTALFAVETMDHRVDASTALHRFATLLLGLFAALALLLASIGIYAVMAFSVAQRRHEIGIRLALGARPGQVVRMIVRQGLLLTSLGIGVGLASAALLTRFMDDLLCNTSPVDPLIYVLSALVAATSAAIACYLAARRATRIDPMDALRSE